MGKLIAAWWNSKTIFLDTGRIAAAMILFQFWPIAQAFIPRALPLFIVLAAGGILVLGLISRVRGETQQPQPLIWPPRDVTCVGLAFLLLMAVSLLWSPMPERGAKDLAVLLAGYLIAVLLKHHVPRIPLIPFSVYVYIALTIASVVLILENWRITSLHDAFLDTNLVFDLNRNAAWLVVVASAALHFRNRSEVSRGSAMLTGLLLVVAVFSGESESAKLALLTASVAALIARFLPVLIKPIFVLLAVGILTMPLLADWLSTNDGRSRISLPGANASHRVALWQGYADLVRQQPILGWGTKADRALGKSGKAAKLAAQRGFPTRTTSPHNVALEIWINHGVAGAVLVSMFLLLVGWRAAALPSRSRVAAVAMVTAIFSVSMTHSSFYQGWWIATIVYGFMVWGFSVRNME